nr:MAG TPA: hypothetical protein [Caudoviricetes sp.]
MPNGKNIQISPSQFHKSYKNTSISYLRNQSIEQMFDSVKLEYLMGISYS